jgi:hypothetical protein
MQHARIVRRSQVGCESLWQLDQLRLEDARAHLRSISARWDETLGRLKRFVER